jgi:hypothetical protein
MKRIICVISLLCVCAFLFFIAQSAQAQTPQSATRQTTEFMANPSPAPYDPTNYGYAPEGWPKDEPPIVKSPLASAVDRLWAIQPCMPSTIIFTVSIHPDSPVYNDGPTTWTYTITDPREIETIIKAMKSVRQIWFGDFSARPDHMHHYTVTLEYSGVNDPKIRGTIKSVSLDLTHEIQGLYDYSKLTPALSKYKPGFKPQDYIMRRIKQ